MAAMVLSGGWDTEGDARTKKGNEERTIAAVFTTVGWQIIKHYY
jgi:hypothetical protein